ncbi:PDZ domain-containing protein [Nocardioides sp. MAH-18]|uniref:PDZ domain-containing protein n=1 Tax=Nocardioides agri TaxID=2682843 RepID=A0A6L6XR71_9ACTN|nr:MULTISPECIES: trypsin-like peptidase domain-containing protein [unclassified Nocardioides]MBA2954286.1 trypsin-like peptidase domain-containing protein [Nocardioides sp. CGMCC 1.13656]MVQ49147.1 PDZ domain-containing protein [Nocardioides sp. MAH-18]
MTDQPTNSRGNDPVHHPLPLGPRPDGPPQAPTYAAAPVPQHTHPRRAGLAVAVVATALVVGAGAGVGGAAAWNTLEDDGSSPSASPARTSQVVDTPDSPGADGSVEQVAAKVLPSVVKIAVTGPDGAGSGSGIILSADGEILTNNHVVEVAGDSGTLTVFFNDGSTAPAKVLGTDPLTDTAVIKAEGVSDLTPATIGKSADLKVGEGVVAIGSPFGLDSTVTSGIVSALNRPVEVGSDGQGNSTTYPAIQTDAAINPGNSGGALVDMAGNVVGINSSIRTASSSTEQGGSIGLGFAIPIDEVMPIADQMRDGETPTHARLGITVGDVASQDAAEAAQGAKVGEVADGSTAAEAGIAAGDVITKVDDHLITGADSLVATIRSYRPGDEVTVTFVHQGKTNTAQLKLDSDAETSQS